MGLSRFMISVDSLFHSRRRVLCCAFVSMLLYANGIAHGEIIVFDNFDDMSFDDGNPITWVTLRRDPRPDASSGDLVLSPVNLGTENAGLGITGISGDVSIQTQFQAAAGVEVGLTAKLRSWSCRKRQRRISSGSFARRRPACRGSRQP